jgi:hypothetical protein
MNNFKDYQGQYAINGRVQIQNTGQIQLIQPFGQWISKYAEDTRFHKYLEIGTWNGRGSTCCFYDGFSKRSDSPTLQSYEINEHRFKEARSLWSSVPQIHIQYGRILENSQCPIFYEVRKVFPNVKEEWHTEDIKNFWNCPYIPIDSPEVVLLDGAEYLTYFEFQQLKKESSIQVYILDDICSEKCAWIYQYLTNNSDWKEIASSKTERNGWAIFERVKYQTELPDHSL